MSAVAAWIYRTPGATLLAWSADPIRAFTLFGTLIALGYGARQDGYSPFVIPFFEPIVGNGLTGVEVLVMLLGIADMVRRSMAGDTRFSRSPLTPHMILVGVVLALVPMLRMFAEGGGFRFAFEMICFPVFVVSFFIWLRLYRRRDLPLALWLLLLAGAYKTIEGILVYFAVGIGWSLLSGWRDGLLLMMCLTAAFFAFAIPDRGDPVYRRLRHAIFLLSPFALFTFIGAQRRSFILGMVFALVVLVWFFNRGERRRVLKLLPLFLVSGAAAIAIFGSKLELDKRVEGISKPSGEGSAAYRLIELYNVGSMVLERPVFGWPMGVMWENRLGIEVERVSTVIPHNTYLYAAWRGGVLGLAAWVLLTGATVAMHVRTIRAARHPLERFAAFWLASATLSIIVAGLTMCAVTDRLAYFLPFISVISSTLPGAFRRPPLPLASTELP